MGENAGGMLSFMVCLHAKLERSVSSVWVPHTVKKVDTQFPGPSCQKGAVLLCLMPIQVYDEILHVC